VTREAAAAAAGTESVLDEGEAAAIEARFKKRGITPHPSNVRQAYFPRGSAVLANPWGTAPGFRLGIGDSSIFVLPGPPREMEAMFDANVVPWLRDRAASRETALARRRLHVFGIPEPRVAESLEPWIRGPNPRIGTTVRKGVVTVSILARAATAEGARAQVEEVAAAARERLHPNLFGEDGKTLPEALVEILVEMGISVATAESCTGGWVAKYLTDVPGVSAVFKEGFVVYENRAKVERLGVPAELLAEHGAVSREVAAAMAEGAARAAGARLSIATTGIAGPSGATPEKPIGLVFLAVAFDGRTRAWRRSYPPRDRRLVREVSSREALQLARLVLLDAPPPQA